jgi:hypothetical protein
VRLERDSGVIATRVPVRRAPRWVLDGKSYPVVDVLADYNSPQPEP